MVPRRVLLVLVIAGTTWSVGGCRSGSDDAPITTRAEGSAADLGATLQQQCLPGRLDDYTDLYRGLTEVEAVDLSRRKGLLLRVIARDGQCLDLNADLFLQRVDVVVAGGKVIYAGREIM